MKENFIKWFIDPLEQLAKNKDSGLIMILISFSLLKEYIKKKYKINKCFHEKLFYLYKDYFHKKENAKLFWDLAVEPFCKNMKFKKTKKTKILLSNDVSFIVFLENAIIINPIDFSLNVAYMILNDIECFYENKKTRVGYNLIKDNKSYDLD